VIKRMAFLLLLLAFLPLPLFAQQTGASVTGHILDPSSASIGGAHLKLTSTTTGAVFTTESDSDGIYQFPFVVIGMYTLSVEKDGFKEYVQQGVGLIAGQKAVIDISLALGAVTQSVTVTANAPLLQPESGDRTWDVSQIRLDTEVFRGQNTIESTWLAPGVTMTGSARKLRPFDTSGSQQENFNGGQSGQGSNLQTGPISGNMVMVDGISSNGGGNGVEFNAINDSVQEVAVQATMFDAQFGWSTGGVVNTITKSGSNRFHGDAYDYVQNTLLNAEDWGSINSHSGRQPWHINMFGGSFSGPIIKNKIFGFYAYQRVWQIQPDPFTVAVPTAAEKQGNFNGLCTSVSTSTGACAAQVQLYDPSTTSTLPASSAGSCGISSSAACRSQSGPLVSGNIIQQINPIAAKILTYFPSPTPSTGIFGTCPAGVTAPTGGCGTYQGNLVNTSAQRKFVDFFPENTGRLDWNLSEKTHAFFRYSENSLAETRSYKYSTIAAFNLADTGTNSPFSRSNQDFALQVTHSFGASTVMEVRTGIDRFTTTSNSNISAGFDVTSLGFSSTYAAEAAKFFPITSISQDNGTGASPLGYQAEPIWSTEVMLAHTRGKHNIRVGFQKYDLGNNYQYPAGDAQGSFTFNGYFTDQNPLGAVSATAGGYALADFELGYMDAGSLGIAANPKIMMHNYSFYFQDDYHLSRKFTLNYGLRWDYSGSTHDRYNALFSGFCTTCQSPLNIPGLPLQGGPTFAGTAGAPSGPFAKKFDNLGPRVGFAYDAGHNTVVRGGYGVIYAQQQAWNNSTPGFSQDTTLVPFIQNGIPNPGISFANPFPNGILTPVGAKWGLAQNVGRSITFPDPNMDIPRTMQYSLEVQRSFGHNWIATVAYVGSRTSRLNVNQQLNYVPLADWPYTPGFQYNTSAPGGGGPATYTYLNTQVANPFLNLPSTSPYASLATGTFLATSTVAQQQLLVPYPQFAVNGVTEDFVPIGRSHYNSLQVEVNKRLSYGLEFTGNYTYSRLLQSLGFLNNQDPEPSQTISYYDIPQQAKILVVYHLPFGPGEHFLNSGNPVINRFVGGWSLEGGTRLEMGLPIPMPSGVMPILAASQKTVSRSLSHWFNTCYTNLAGANVNCSIDSTPAWKQLQQDQLYEWSPNLRQIREPGTHRVDASIAKNTQIKENYTLRFRADFIDAFNSSEWFTDNPDTTFSDANFGIEGPPQNSTPSNDPRVIMLSLKLIF
jgi:hypothetical protein